MILYKSSRGLDKNQYTFSEAILKGIAEDGGLLMPTTIPNFGMDQLQSLVSSNYQEKARFVFKLFTTDYAEPTLNRIIAEAYADNFDDPGVAPLIRLKENQHILELWHGPTSAFKDMALQIMPLLFSEAVKSDYLILVATSGDTGKAALEGYKDKKHVKIIVFYPEGRVSALQEKQMVTQEGDNVLVCALQGDFDDAQRVVKELFKDTDFNKQLLSEHQLRLSSANSINWGRLLPQIIYYISGYCDLVKQGALKLGDQMDVCVPTGNFGNLLAAFIAKKMGLPIGKFLCASNENNVLSDFLRTGVYDISKRKLVQTPSPSMDILIASNIERLLSLITGDTTKVNQWMQELKTNNCFTVDAATKEVLQKEFFADWVSNQESLKQINSIFKETAYLMDPHTAVAQIVAERYTESEGTAIPMLICSTAHWAKFAKDVYTALELQEHKPEPDEFAKLKAISELAPNLKIPGGIAGLQAKPVRFRETCAAESETVQKMINNWLEK